MRYLLFAMFIIFKWRFLLSSGKPPIGLAKQFVHLSESPKQSFWPTQYYAGSAVLSLNRLWHSGERYIYMQVYSGSCMFVVGHFNITAWSHHLNIRFSFIPSLPDLPKMSPFCSISYHLFVFFLLRTYHLTYCMLCLNIFNLTSPLESRFCVHKCVSFNAECLEQAW